MSRLANRSFPRFNWHSKAQDFFFFQPTTRRAAHFTNIDVSFVQAASLLHLHLGHQPNFFVRPAPLPRLTLAAPKVPISAAGAQNIGPLFDPREQLS
jgi:hypothetical protein